MEIEKKSDFSNKIEILLFLLEEAVKKKHIFDEETQIFIRKIDSNSYHLVIKTKTQEIKIKFLQILEAISIYFVLKPQRFFTLKLNLNDIFIPVSRNSYKADNLDIYFNKDKKKKLLDLFENRIIKKFLPPKQWKYTEITEILLISIAKFLDPKTLWKLMCTNQEIYQRFFKKNEFWFSLYHSRFRKTGFKASIAQWKEVYINKIKG